MVRVKKFSIMITMLTILFLSVGISTFAASNRVYDDAQLFSESQKEELQVKADLLSEQIALDINIVTIDNSEGKPSSQFAEDFYNEHAFGYGETLDGILYLLNMDEREVYIFTRDRANDYFTDARIEEVLDNVYPYLGDEEYSESVHVFLSEVKRVMNAGIPEEQGRDTAGESSHVGDSSGGPNYVGDTTEDTSLVKELALYFAISIVIGAITVGIMSMNNKGRSTVNEGTYLEDNSFIVTSKTDLYYNTIVTQQKIPKNNNSGGGSMGGSSGGGSIGGGGRKF